MNYIKIALLSAIVILLFGIGSGYPAQGIKGVTGKTTFTGTGTTNSSTTVATTSTQVIPAGWSNFAMISNYGTATISCYLDNQTAASSSVTSTAGLNIGAVSSTFSGEDSVTFGPQGNIPYVGAINCIASQRAKVGIIYN